MRPQVDRNDPLGLGVVIDEDGSLTFSGPAGKVDPELRWKRDMAGLLLDERAQGPDPMYLMYRGVECSEHEQMFSDRNVRHDVTVLMPGQFGSEYVKTAGHYHMVSDRGVTYPEVYQVCQGHALYLLQRPDPAHDEVIVDAVKASSGDVVVVPPDYGHVTVNIGTQPLVMTNIVIRLPSRYEPYQMLQGAACYVVNYDGPRLLLNPGYRLWKQVKIWRAEQWKENGFSSEPLYWQFVSAPERFSFLTAPDERWG